MRKTFVLDTNILLHDPRSIFRFEDNDVVIPIYVIEEVDNFKRDASELGRNARQVCRFLDEFREKGGSLSRGVTLESGGTLTVALPSERAVLPSAFDKGTMDQAILQTAFAVREQRPDQKTIFITMDANLRIRADALGMDAQNYEGERVDTEELESGVIEIEVEPAVLEGFLQKGAAKVDAEKLRANDCILLRDRSSTTTALGRYDAQKGLVVALRTPREGLLGVRPRNLEQHYALDLLLDENIRLVTLIGKAGTGKTLLALAAGLQRTVEDGHYTRMLVARPIMPLGKDLGALPGEVEEKLSPWMQPIYDNLEFIYSLNAPRKGQSTYADLLESGQIQVEPLTYIRGRSIPKQYIIIDEAQNLTPHEMKTIITRSGDDTKIVLTGDPGQIDNPYVDSLSNGLTVVANKFRDQKIAGHLVLQKGERSELAELAANLL